LSDYVHQQLSGRVITGDAPDDPVIVRAIGVAAHCPDPSAPYSYPIPTDSLLGCEYSCPVKLDDLDGPVLLDLDTFGQHCEEAVDVCAGALQLPP
jgi:hypothetical protein